MPRSEYRCDESNFAHLFVEPSVPVKEQKDSALPKPPMPGGDASDKFKKPVPKKRVVKKVVMKSLVEEQEKFIEL
jgi:hypothetical protein